MITSKDLIAAGYKKFHQENLRQFTDVFYQKRFDDEKGKKYFITIAEYDNGNYPTIIHASGKYSFEPDSQFISKGVTFNVTMLHPESIEDMEAFFERMWQSMECDYYETNYG